MKQTFKKFMSCGLILVCVIAMTACGAKAEESGINEELATSMITTAEGLTEAIVVLSQEEIDSYKESGDAFTESAMETWEASKDDLGEYKGLGASEAEEITDGYSVTVPAEFSGRNAEILFVFDETGTPASMSINPEYTMGEQMGQAAGNTLMGVGIVFVILIFLSFLISLFKHFPKLQKKFEKASESAVAVPEAAKPAPAVAAAPVVSATDDSELIAVIAAAIAASEGTSTDSFVVRSIKKVNRKKW